MTVANLAKMRYLNAAIEEGLRMFPPAPVGLPRVSPKGGAMVCGRFVPEGVSSNKSIVLQLGMFS
jgi:hypothetical protein